MVDLMEGKSSSDNIARKRKIHICNSVLSPLSKNANAVFLYGTFLDDDLARLSGANYSKKRGKIQINDRDMIKYLPVLDRTSDGSKRGSLLFELPYNEEVLTPILKGCYDPTVMSGLSSVNTKSALNYAKSNMTGDKFYALLSEANSGLEWLFFLATGDVLKRLSELAANLCQPTKGFIRTFGPGTEFTPLRHRLKFGTGGAE